jgi:hypothetical protein
MDIPDDAVVKVVTALIASALDDAADYRRALGRTPAGSADDLQMAAAYADLRDTLQRNSPPWPTVPIAKDRAR